MSRYTGGGIGASLTEVVKNLIIINVLFFLVTYVFASSFDSWVPEGFWGLTDFLGIHYFDSPKFRPFQIVTNMFTHANIFHIFFNMFSLFILGPPLESRWGPKRFLTYYLIAGFGAALTHVAFNATRVYMRVNELTPDLATIASDATLQSVYAVPAVGASGAIYGIFIAFAMMYPNVKMFVIPIPFPIKAKYLVLLMLAYDLFFGVQQYAGDPIAHFAHLGGAVFGFLMLMYWRLQK